MSKVLSRVPVFARARQRCHFNKWRSKIVVHTTADRLTGASPGGEEDEATTLLAFRICKSESMCVMIVSRIKLLWCPEQDLAHHIMSVRLQTRKRRTVK